jgi:hypothetical protein
MLFAVKCCRSKNPRAIELVKDANNIDTWYSPLFMTLVDNAAQTWVEYDYTGDSQTKKGALDDQCTTPRKENETRTDPSTNPASNKPVTEPIFPPTSYPNNNLSHTSISPNFNTCVSRKTMPTTQSFSKATNHP